MTLQEAFIDLTKSINKIGDKQCLLTTFCTCSSTPLTSGGAVDTGFVPVLTVIGDSTPEIDTLKSEVEVILLAQHQTYTTWIQTFYDIFNPDSNSINPGQYFTSTYAGAYQASFYRRIFTTTQFTLLEVANAHQLNLIMRYQALTSEAELETEISVPDLFDAQGKLISVIDVNGQPIDINLASLIYKSPFANPDFRIARQSKLIGNEWANFVTSLRSYIDAQ